MPFAWRLAISVTVAFLTLTISLGALSDSEVWLWSLPWLHRILPPLESGPNPLAGLIALGFNAVAAGWLAFVATRLWRSGRE